MKATIKCGRYPDLEVTAHSLSVEGLLATRPHKDGKELKGGWQITHAKSGFCIDVHHIKTLADAHMIAHELESINWTQDASIYEESAQIRKKVREVFGNYVAGRLGSMVWTRVEQGTNHAVFKSDTGELRCMCPENTVRNALYIADAKDMCEHIQNYLTRTTKKEQEWGWF